MRRKLNRDEKKQSHIGRHIDQYLNNQEELNNNLSRASAEERDEDTSAHASVGEGNEEAVVQLDHSKAKARTGKKAKQVGGKGDVIPLEQNKADPLIQDFYSAIGQPKIPLSILKYGRQQVRELLKDFSLADVATAIAYVENGQKDDNGKLLDERGKPIGSIGYLSYIIAAAVEKAAMAAQEAAAQAAADAQRAQEEKQHTRKALADREAWLRAKPDWMTQKMYRLFLKREAKRETKQETTEPEAAQAA